MNKKNILRPERKEYPAARKKRTRKKTNTIGLRFKISAPDKPNGIGRAALIIEFYIFNWFVSKSFFQAENPF
jgi:hypothetical protein